MLSASKLRALLPVVECSNSTDAFHASVSPTNKNSSRRRLMASFVSSGVRTTRDTHVKPSSILVWHDITVGCWAYFRNLWVFDVSDGNDCMKLCSSPMSPQPKPKP